MNWPRYKFSRESEPELLEFFKTVAEQKSAATTSVDIKLWQQLLPMVKQDELQHKMNSVKIATASEVIDITESDDDKDGREMGSFEELPESKSRSNMTLNESLIDSLQELLEIETVLSEDIIKQLGSEIPQQQLKEMFMLFGSDLNPECTLKLWKSIISVDCVERNIVVSYFSRCILVQKILKEYNGIITTVLVDVITTFPDELIVIIQKILETINENSELKILRNNLNALPDDCKNILLRMFLHHCIQLESQHLGTLLSLLTPQTDAGNINKMVELMSRVANNFVSEKTFGKLLLEVVHSLRANVIQNEEQLRVMISMNKSTYKTQIVKGFDRYVQDLKLLSQSLRV